MEARGRTPENLWQAPLRNGAWILGWGDAVSLDPFVHFFNGEASVQPDVRPRPDLFPCPGRCRTIDKNRDIGSAVRWASLLGPVLLPADEPRRPARRGGSPGTPITWCGTKCPNS